MLVVKTALNQSTIHGLGVFAAEAISKGTEVWRFQEGFDLEKDVADLAALPVVAREWFKTYGYHDHRQDIYILSFDNARHINHSEDPNIRPDFQNHRCGIGIAARDIAVGEELTIDYREIEKESFLSCTKA
jgi:uncharacterized protein